MYKGFWAKRNVAQRDETTLRAEVCDTEATEWVELCEVIDEMARKAESLGQKSPSHMSQRRRRGMDTQSQGEQKRVPIHARSLFKGGLDSAVASQ
eukprot:gene8113-19973_t